MRTQKLISDINSSNGKAVTVVVRINKEDDDKGFSFYCNSVPFVKVFEAMGYGADDCEILFSCESDANACELLKQAYCSLGIEEPDVKAANCEIVINEED